MVLKECLLGTWEPIEKPTGGWEVVPNLVDYERVCATFTWEAARRELDGLPGGKGLNIAHEAVDRHAAGTLRDQVALRWLGKRGDRHDVTYGDLDRLTNRFANVLRGLGVGKGDRVFTLAGRIPELYVDRARHTEAAAASSARSSLRSAPSRSGSG